MRTNENKPASPFFAFPSRFDSIGFPKRSLKADSVPKNPGMRKSNRLHNSRTLFCMGVPERIRRCWAWIHLTALVSLVFEFFMTCPSSNMQYSHLWVSRFEMSFRTTSYDVMTTSYDCSFVKRRTRSLELPVYKTGRKVSEYFSIS